MHFILMLVFLFVWLLVLWFGSIALQRTGMEREKARFQALSALTGSGFTTSEAESVVNNKKRRSIISWLMFTGNAGALLFVIALILYVKAAVVTPSLAEIVIIAACLIFLFLVVRYGVVDKLSDMAMGRAGPGNENKYPAEVLLQVGDHAIARIAAGEKPGLPGSTLQSSGLDDKGLTILAIERGNTIIQRPGFDATVHAGDRIICYDKLSNILQ